MSTDIRIFKLVTNEDVVATVVSETDTTIVIKNAIQIAILPSPDNSKDVKFGFYPFPYYSKDKDKDYTIYKQAIVFVTEDVGDDFKDNYNRIFNTVVTPPTPKIIL